MNKENIRYEYEKIGEALNLLINNGIYEDDAIVILQTLGYLFFDEELFPDDEDEVELHTYAPNEKALGKHFTISEKYLYYIINAIELRGGETELSVETFLKTYSKSEAYTIYGFARYHGQVIRESSIY